ncbi:MAG: hypothetical protein M9947_16915 [Thermomicrobiales bacterium]|nr:hypothetical protein [Thermomicrobiales bacterium]
MSELSLINAQSDTGPVCVLRGDVADQAALMGVLNGLDGLGLSLLSIACSDRTGAGASWLRCRPAGGGRSKSWKKKRGVSNGKETEHSHPLG